MEHMFVILVLLTSLTLKGVSMIGYKVKGYQHFHSQ